MEENEKEAGIPARDGTIIIVECGDPLEVGLILALIRRFPHVGSGMVLVGTNPLPNTGEEMKTLQQKIRGALGEENPEAEMDTVDLSEPTDGQIQIIVGEIYKNPTGEEPEHGNGG